MKKSLQSFLLMAFLLLVGSSAWAGTGDVTTNADIDFSNAISDGAVAGTVNSMTIGATTNFNTEIASDESGQYLFLGDGINTVTIPSDQYAGKKDVVTIQFDMAIADGSNNHAAFYIQDADGGNIGYMKCALWSNGVANETNLGIAMDNTTFNKNGTSPKDALWNKRTSFTITLDYLNNTITTVTQIQGGTAKDPIVVTMTNKNPVAKFVVQAWPSAAAGGAARRAKFGNLLIKTTEGDYSVASANYTVNWVCGTIIKTDTRSGDIGATITLSPSDKETFFSEDKTAKYQYVSDNTKDLTIKDDGSTVVEIILSEVGKYTYSVVDNWGNTIASGEKFEDEAQMAYWSKYAKHDSKWYQASGSEYGLEMNDVDNEWTVNYSTESSISYFFEAEALNKTKNPATEASGVKYSAGKGVGHAANSSWYSDPLTEGGVYTLAISGYARRSGGEEIGISIRDSEGNLTETGKSFKYDNAGTEQINKEVEGIEIPAGYSVALVQPNWNSTSYIDYITLTKTGDLVTTYAVNIAEGIENGTVVAEPTSAKEGDEVTLTITPAEGYELASVSVTGVTSDITVTVTDNKFTMPADDVTVNATFQVPAVAYDLTLAEGSDSHGTIAFTVDGKEAAKAKKGDVVTVSVTPAEGYVVTSVTARAYTSWENAARTTSRNTTDGPEIVDNIDVVKQEDGTWKFTMPEANVLLQVEYTAVYAINIAEGIENGTVVAEPTSAKEGDEVTLTITPAEGYELASVSVTGVTSDITVIVTDNKFTMPDDDVTVNATFVKVSPIAYAVGMQNGTVTGPTSAKAGEKVTLTVTPEEGYELETLKITCEVSGNEINYDVTDYSFTMPSEGVYIIGTFKKKPIYIETDLTAQFESLTEYDKWTGATGYATWAAPKVKTNTGAEVYVCEKFVGTCENTGDVFYQTVTGLAAGTYKIELYGAAAYTGGRDGFPSSVFSQNEDAEDPVTTETGVTLYAETSEGKVSQEIPLNKATSFASVATAVLENVVVGANGEVKIGMNKTSLATNWHVVQLKGVTAQVDARELHANAVAAANAALSAEENAVIVGEEKTALEAAIEKNSEVAEETADAYKAAIEALQTATSTFTSAREAYAALASTIKAVEGYVANYVYASAEKTAAVTAAAEAVPTSAADATSKNTTLITALRVAAESNANAEGVEGAESITITNPSAEDGINGWTTVKGEGSDGSIGVLSNEPWTSADGSTSHKYFDGGNWGANAWDVALTQDVELAAGKYLLSVIGRASGDVALTLFAGENKAAMPSIGAAGGLFDRGWNISSVEFEVEDNSTVTIGVQGVTSVLHNWMSFSDFHLVLLEAIPEYAVAYAVGMQNGTVSGPTVAKAGDKVTLTVTPEEGYELETLKITCEVSGNEVNYDVEDYSFTMPKEGVYIIATFVQTTGIDAASATKGKKTGVKKFFKNGRLIILDKDGNEFGANGVAK